MSRDKVFENMLRATSKRLEECTGLYSEEVWVAKFRGEIVRTPRGKSSWGARGHVLTALQTSILSTIVYDYQYKITKREIIDELIASGELEIKKISDGNL